jgi:site-specific DNA-methyltransferase (adenine-specific)
MGQKWDSFRDLDHFEDWVAEWANSMMRVLYPGAVCMFFGGTRTYHRLARGLERGGFEITDCLMWLYGSGFPKSHDISKGIDKAAGVEREVVGKQYHPTSKDRTGDKSPYQAEDSHLDGSFNITEPSTPEAEIWQGYGTALKPAWEPIILCRTPRGSMTFAELAKTYGTGAINIDGCRVGLPYEGTRQQPNIRGCNLLNHQGRYDDVVLQGHPQGRWPANLLLSHHEDCVKVGEFEVEGRTINRWKEEMKPFGGGAGEEYESEKLPPETVERWACVGECPVRALDDQAGDKKAGVAIGRNASVEGTGGSRVYGGGRGLVSQDTVKGKDTLGYGGSGGPARFFYTGKASRKEKDKGCEHLFWKRADGEMVLISEEEWVELPKKERAKGNIHPSVKPLDLLRYLAKLFKPPDLVKSRLLVPFSGTGSEMIAAMQAGWGEVVGVEIDENYKTIADARIAGTMGMF